MLTVAMNNQPEHSNGEMTLDFSGRLSLSREVLEEFARHLTKESPAPPKSVVALGKPDEPGRPPRLAYSMKETAEMLGVSYGSIHRLVKRGLMRSSLALRTKMISKKEIERFLNSTMTEL